MMKIAGVRIVTDEGEAVLDCDGLPQSTQQELSSRAKEELPCCTVE